jgi:hypothetical protein
MMLIILLTNPVAIDNEKRLKEANTSINKLFNVVIIKKGAAHRIIVRCEEIVV